MTGSKIAILRLNKRPRKKETPPIAVIEGVLRVDPLGLEPRLFCTKNRRVASYTMGQSGREDKQILNSQNHQFTLRSEVI
jgi:hypothetical protein